MDLLIQIFILIISALVTVGGIIGIYQSQSKAMFKFVLCFSVSLISVFFLLTFTGNRFVQSLILSLIISTAFIKGD